MENTKVSTPQLGLEPDLLIIGQSKNGKISFFGWK